MAMAKTGIVALALVVLMSATWPGSLAQTSSSCTNVLISMSPCLNYITGNSTTPSSSCCSQLASVVKSQPQCLCQVISGGGSSASSLGININQTQALQLPSACKVQTPSISSCTGAASPSATTSPSSDNSGSTTTPTTSTSTTGSTGGSSVDTSEGHSIKSGLAMFVPLFFIANFARDFLVNI